MTSSPDALHLTQTSVAILAILSLMYMCVGAFVWNDEPNGSLVSLFTTEGKAM